ncbi:uncharacterized protein KD926_010025 [Aspergillus affinis]|uniref:uncharacterized protein n=1 Tax=Aspergillus affinis TaxID=1070780 RepID=UPI0022FEAAAC|nr:uncharacterized protein KD926_010025 [Aspergillus affinis]KAI9039041.1 hypothetical protein KD926_010025 [Aspergillus affinis]
MPLYTIEHSIPLSKPQRDALAQSITHIHTRKFTTPSLFVNVQFVDSTRQSRKIESAWNDIVNIGSVGQTEKGKRKETELNRVFILGAITAGLECGVLLPRAGGDTTWLKDNMALFEERAREGDEDFIELLEEIKRREDLHNCPCGWDQYCQERKVYGVSDFDNGTLISGAVWDANCVFPIPEGLNSVDAAPLMCAGATVWTVLTRFGIEAGDRVGIMGVGGLGHISIKLAAALGYHVVVLSSSESKMQEATEYGASEYHVFRSGEKPQDLKPLKHLLLCGSGSSDYQFLVPLMDSPSSIYPLTVTFAICDPHAAVVLPRSREINVGAQSSLEAAF